MVGRRGMGIVGVAATAKVVSNRTQARADAERTAGEQAQAPAAAEQPPADDPIAKVEQLAKLHAAGALTDEEFAAAKAKALGI